VAAWEVCGARLGVGLAALAAAPLAAFLTVARHPGLGPTGYAKLLGTIQPIMSRILLEIGRKARAREEGLGLVDNVGPRLQHLAGRALFVGI
jgi:hypothetical protein